MKKYFIFGILCFIILMGYVIAVTVISDTTLSSENVTLTGSVHINNTRNSDRPLVIERISTSSDDKMIVLRHRQTGSRGSILWQNESNNNVAKITAHTEDDAGSTETHWQVYTPAGNGSWISRFDIDSWVDQAHFDFNDVEKIDFSGENTESRNLSFNGDRGFVRYTSAGKFQVGAGSNKQLQLWSDDVELMRFPITNSNITRILDKNGNTVNTINHTTGALTIGAGATQVNVTLTSPDGTEFDCGVNNSGSLTCS